MADGKPHGFAALTPEQRREMARRGGKAAHAKGTAHKWSPEEARRAAALGGAETGRRRREVSHGI